MAIEQNCEANGKMTYKEKKVILYVYIKTIQIF